MLPVSFSSTKSVNVNLLKVQILIRGLGLGAWVFEFRLSVFGFRVSSFGSRVSSFGFRVSGFEFRVSGFSRIAKLFDPIRYFVLPEVL